MVRPARTSKRAAQRAAVRSARSTTVPKRPTAVPNTPFPDLLFRPNYPLVITGYTVTSHLGDYYKKSVQRLVKSLIKFDMPHIVYPLKGVKDWCLGCSFKPTIIEYTLARYKRPVLWIDADGEVFKYPEIFDNAGFDIALHNQNGHWLSGTLYMSLKSLPFVKQWKESTPNNVPDEISLLRLYSNSSSGLTLHQLPDIYNRVIHASSNTSDLIIGHYLRPDLAADRKVEAVQL